MRLQKKLIAISLTCSFAYFLSGCKNDYTNGNDLKLDSLKNIVRNISFQHNIIKKDTTRVLESLTSKIPTTREELGNMRTVVKILNGNQSAGITVPGFGGVTLAKDESSLSVYYIETKVVDTSVYGIGYSVHYLFRKLKRGLSITNLPQIAASVQLESNKSQVIYSLQSYGIKSLSLVNYFKPTINKDFNVEGFGVMQSSIDGIHNILSDSLLSSKTKYDPMLLSLVKPSDLQQ
jgi:hypothetical protein